MPLSKQTLLDTFKEMELTIEQDGQDFVYTSRGRFAPVLHSVVTLDEDGDGATVMTALLDEVPEAKRSAVCELLNLVHGQSLWNVRFHLDDAGRVFAVGKHTLWGKPFNAVQFGDIFFSLLVSTDRLYPCLQAVNEGATPTQAFEHFFSQAEEAPAELR